MENLSSSETEQPNQILDPNSQYIASPKPLKTAEELGLQPTDVESLRPRDVVYYAGHYYTSDDYDGEKIEHQFYPWKVVDGGDEYPGLLCLETIRHTPSFPPGHGTSDLPKTKFPLHCFDQSRIYMRVE